MAKFPIFFNDSLTLEVESQVPVKWFRFAEDEVCLNYHKINQNMTAGMEFFITRAAAEDLTQPGTLHRVIDFAPPDFDGSGTLDRDFLNAAVVAFSDAEFDLTASVGVSENYNTPTDFGTANASQTKIFNKAVGQVFLVASGHASFDERFNFKLAAHLGTPTGDLTVKIWSLDVSDLPQTELASVTVTPVSNVVNTAEFLSVNLPKNTKYAFTIQDDGTNDTDNTYRIERSTEAIYTPGDYIDDLGGWAADNTLDLVGSFQRR